MTALTACAPVGIRREQAAGLGTEQETQCQTGGICGDPHPHGALGCLQAKGGADLLACLMAGAGADQVRTRGRSEGALLFWQLRASEGSPSVMTLHAGLCPQWTAPRRGRPCLCLSLVAALRAQVQVRAPVSYAALGR